jgi:hypothetical protein
MLDHLPAQTKKGSRMVREEAKQIALKYLEARAREGGLELALLDEHTIERNFGWVFFYQSKRYMESGEIREALAGNAPIVVTKADGRVHLTGTTAPLEQFLKRFETYQSGEE